MVEGLLRLIGKLSLRVTSLSMHFYRHSYYYKILHKMGKVPVKFLQCTKLLVKVPHVLTYICIIEVVRLILYSYLFMVGSWCAK